MPKPIDATIAETPTRAGEVLRVQLSAYRGQQYVHARRWYDADGHPKAGKGLAVRVDLLPWLRAQLETAERAALEAGLLEAEDYEAAGQEPPPSWSG